jgi:hypothetical protein
MAKRERSETGWAILGKCGFYTGWQMTRNAMIAQHVIDIAGGKYHYHSGPLNDKMRELWARCQEDGDSVVKIKLMTV